MSQVPTKATGEVPSCFVRFADFDGRRACIHDSHICSWNPSHTFERFKLLAGKPFGDNLGEHPFSASMTPVVETFGADTLEILEPTWRIAESWVRVGTLL